MCIAPNFSFLPPSLSGVISVPSSVTGFSKVLDSSLQRVLVTHRFLLSLFGFPCSRLLPSNPQETMQELKLSVLCKTQGITEETPHSGISPGQLIHPDQRLRLGQR